MLDFKIKARKGKARTGTIKLKHGSIQTPNMAIVATHGKIKNFLPFDYKKARPELMISNTFHLWVNGKVPEIRAKGGLHKWNGFKGPLMTDSGGFQVFSLGWGKVHNIGKIVKEGSSIKKLTKKDEKELQARISEKGVVFNYDGKKKELTPEKSMKIQKDIGADIIFAFDECTSPYHGFKYNKEAMERTHRWAVRSLESFQKLNKDGSQNLFGIVQGGIYKKLRKQSSKFIGSLPFDGFGIGGSFGEREMGEVIDWAVSGMPDNKPRHLLGVGGVKDIFLAVRHGIDLFDCVIPTREGRHGRIYTLNGKIDIRRAKFAGDGRILFDKIRYADVHKAFRSDPDKAQRLGMMANIHFYKKLFEEIRRTVGKGENLSKLEKKYKKL